jgi:hypothetical protein
MGSCNAKDSQDLNNKKRSVLVNTYDNVLSAPPNLLQKLSLPSNFNLILNTENLTDKLCDVQLNKNLEKGGKVDTALGEFITSNSLKEGTFVITAPQLFEKVHELSTKTKEFDKPKLVKKVLDDFHKMVYDEFSQIIKESSRNHFFKDNNFCIKTICHLTEVYQILLTFKVHKIEKKKNKSMKFWWLPDSTPMKNCELDTFAYARKKFVLINKEIGNQYKTLLGNQGESQPLTVMNHPLPLPNRK